MRKPGHTRMFYVITKRRKRNPKGGYGQQYTCKGMPQGQLQIFPSTLCRLRNAKFQASYNMPFSSKTFFSAVNLCLLFKPSTWILILHQGNNVSSALLLFGFIVYQKLLSLKLVTVRFALHTGSEWQCSYIDSVLHIQSVSTNCYPQWSRQNVSHKLVHRHLLYLILATVTLRRTLCVMVHFLLCLFYNWITYCCLQHL